MPRWNRTDVQTALDDIEKARKSGRAVMPPARMQPGNILGSKTAAFNEAVKEQGTMLNPKPKDPNADINDVQSRLRKAVQARSAK